MYSHTCKATPIQVQDITFVVDLHVFPLCGANLVLGVQWLKSLGLVLMDYNTLSMKFICDGRIIEFQGDIDSSLHLITPPQLCRLFRKEGVSSYFHIHITPTNLPPTQTNTDHLPSPIQNLIAQFTPFFQSPLSLPPSRPTNHHIHLLPYSEPVNVRPYPYPHFQKQ